MRHFEFVEAERERKWGSGASGAIEDPVSNDAARSLVVG